MTRTEISEALNIASARLDLIRKAWMTHSSDDLSKDPQHLAMVREAGLLAALMGQLIATVASDELRYL